MLTDPYYDPLLMGSPLRRRGVCKVISAALLVLLALATLVQLSVLASMPQDIASVFLKALMLSSLLAVVPLAVLWFLDRRERETPWLFAAAFLWGGCIATALALPFNTASFALRGHRQSHCYLGQMRQSCSPHPFPRRWPKRLPRRPECW